MQDWRDGLRAVLTLSKAFFPVMFTKSPEIVVALLPIAVASIILDLRAMREYAILKLENGEILVPAKPRIQRIVAYSLMADFLMLAVLAQFLSGYDSVVLANSTVVYGLYLMETSGAKGAIEAFRPEIEKFEEVEVEEEKIGL